VMEGAEPRLRLGAGLSLDERRHERCRRLGDRATRPDEAHVGDPLVLELEPERQAVATHWIVALGASICRLHLPEVSRRPVVIEDETLIQIGEIRHQPKTFRTEWSPSTSASTSSSVL